MRKCFLFLGLAAAFAMATPSTHASAFVFVTPTGSTVGDGPVSAEADFTVVDGSITIVLKDLLADPTSVGQLLSDLSFTVGNGDLTSSSLSSSSGEEITVNADGTFTLGSTVDTAWGYDGAGTLDVLGTPEAPQHLIIGPPNSMTGLYDNANASIAGNGPHNPFLNGFATFTITGAGITADTTITGAVFSFGTTPGVTVPGIPGGGPGPPAVPEPSTMISVCVGLAMVGLILQRRRVRA